MTVVAIQESTLGTLAIHARAILLIAAPLLVSIGAALPLTKGRWPLRAALVLIAVETGCLFLPLSGGIGIQSDMIFESRVIFAGLFAIYALILFLPKALREPDQRLFSTVLPLAFLVLYAAGTMFLLNAANTGLLDNPITLEAPSLSKPSPELSSRNAPAASETMRSRKG